MHARAPEARARTKAWPERMPPSTITPVTPPTAPHGLHALGHRGDRGGRAIELPAAVIGAHERAGAGLGGRARILDVEDALENELARPQAADPLDVLPTQRRIELAGGPLRQRRDIFHAAHMAGDVAEGFSLAAQD